MHDVTILEITVLLLPGMSSFNMKAQVPNDILDTGLYVPKENLETQKHINDIQKWTENQQMVLNEDKTKNMLFNFSKNHQFTTRLTLNGKNIKLVKDMKLLGVIVTNDLKWHKNTKHVVKKAWARIQLLKKVAEFGASTSDKLQIYKTFVRSALEQSCTVWHSSLTKGNERDLERVQKAALKLITNRKYKTYEEELEVLNIETLKKRREKLCLKFALKCTQTKKTSNIFKHTQKQHQMKLKSTNTFKITYSKTERLKRSAVPYMERLLNKYHKSKVKMPCGPSLDGAPGLY